MNQRNYRSITSGIGDFKLVCKEGYSCFDKTRFISELEHFGRFVCFLKDWIQCRPFRKGICKSLFFLVLFALLTAGCESDMYKTYMVKKTVEPIAVNADWDKPAWQDIAPITIGLHMGDRPVHKPKTQARLAWDDDYLYVIFRVEDRYVRAVATENFGKVYQDSCVEFFFTPQADVTSGYFNLEANCIGTILMQHTTGDDQRFLMIEDLNTIKVATSLPKGIPINPEITEPLVWTLEYALPWRMLKKYAPVKAPALGVKWRANFYKCADMTSHPHWLTWSKIPLDKPSFHQPQYFGYLLFSE